MSAEQQRILAILERFAAHNPNPATELHYGTPYQLLVAVILSAQSTDRAVNKVTERLFAIAPTPGAMVTLGEERLAEQLKSLGLFRSKASHVIAASRLLLERHGGAVPDSRDALMALPGVGRKTANVVLNTVFNQPTIGVDTHVQRVARRLGLAAGTTPLAIERELESRIPEPCLQHLHHWLVLHGRYVCLARRPRCSICIVRDLCPAAKTGSTDPVTQQESVDKSTGS